MCVQVPSPLPEQAFLDMPNVIALQVKGLIAAAASSTSDAQLFPCQAQPDLLGESLASKPDQEHADTAQADGHTAQPAATAQAPEAAREPAAQPDATPASQAGGASTQAPRHETPSQARPSPGGPLVQPAGTSAFQADPLIRKKLSAEKPLPANAERQSPRYDAQPAAPDAASRVRDAVLAAGLNWPTLPAAPGCSNVHLDVHKARQQMARAFVSTRSLSDGHSIFITLANDPAARIPLAASANSSMLSRFGASGRSAGRSALAGPVGVLRTPGATPAATPTAAGAAAGAQAFAPAGLMKGPSLLSFPSLPSFGSTTMPGSSGALPAAASSGQLPAPAAPAAAAAQMHVAMMAPAGEAQAQPAAQPVAAAPQPPQSEAAAAASVPPATPAVAPTMAGTQAAGSAEPDGTSKPVDGGGDAIMADAERPAPAAAPVSAAAVPAVAVATGAQQTPADSAAAPAAPEAGATALQVGPQPALQRIQVPTGASADGTQQQTPPTATGAGASAQAAGIADPATDVGAAGDTPLAVAETPRKVTEGVREIAMQCLAVPEDPQLPPDVPRRCSQLPPAPHAGSDAGRRPRQQQRPIPAAPNTGRVAVLLDEMFAPVPSAPSWRAGVKAG